MKSRFIILVGPSGSGKSAIIDYLIRQWPYFHYAKSATTREKRSDSEDNYIFVDDKQFGYMLMGDEFLEDSCYAGHMYGTPLSELEKAAEDGKIAIKAMDISGALAAKKALGDRCTVFFVYRKKSDVIESLIERAKTGESNAKDLAKRIESLDAEYQHVFQCDAIIRNTGSVRDAAETVRKFCFASDFKKLVENAHEITLMYSQLMEDPDFHSKAKEKEQECEKYGTSYAENLSSEVIQLAVEFERIYDEDDSSYLEQIWEFSDAKLKEWVQE